MRVTLAIDITLIAVVLVAIGQVLILRRLARHDATAAGLAVRGAANMEGHADLGAPWVDIEPLGGAGADTGRLASPVADHFGRDAEHSWPGHAVQDGEPVLLAVGA